MKVLFVSSLYYPHVGGIETMISELANFYRRDSIKSVVLTKKWPLDLADRDEHDGIPVFRVKSARTNEEFYELIRWVKSHQLEIQSDVIHVIGVRRPLPLVALLLSRLWGVPIICTVAGGEIPNDNDLESERIWEEGKELTPNVLMQADHITCVSQALTSNLQKLMPNIGGIKTLYAGMDFSIIKVGVPEERQRPYILALRRLVYSKGIHILIEAFSLIQNDFPNLDLLIAGEGPEEQNLRNLVSQKNLSRVVSFLGNVSLSRGISLLKGAALTVLPSLSEGGGLVNIEAQASGCPVIASRVGGIPEYVNDGRSGLLFESGNSKDLAEKIKLVLTDRNLRRQLIEGGFEHSKKFDWEILAPQYVALYEEAISGHNKGIGFYPWSALSADLWKQLKNTND